MKNRIDYLDGIRGFSDSIGARVITPSFAGPKIVPYGNTFSDFAIFEAGWLGVQLFFLLSGFVILMTLETLQKLSRIYVSPLVTVVSYDAD